MALEKLDHSSVLIFLKSDARFYFLSKERIPEFSMAKSLRGGEDDQGDRWERRDRADGLEL
jgi:hypothetical protein